MKKTNKSGLFDMKKKEKNGPAGSRGKETNWCPCCKPKSKKNQFVGMGPPV